MIVMLQQCHVIEEDACDVYTTIHCYIQLPNIDCFIWRIIILDGDVDELGYRCIKFRDLTNSLGASFVDLFDQSNAVGARL